MAQNKGILYIVATPIGNLDDLTFRAVSVLKSVDLIAAEDTRHSRQLLKQHGINIPLTSLHEHNEKEKSAKLLRRLAEGDSISIISDAGTPLINDPGFRLVRLAQDAGIKVVPVPGPCALIAALSACGLPTTRFIFEGFLPRGSTARKIRFQELRSSTATLIFYESCHRIVKCLQEVQAVFPEDREISIARELTKLHESIIRTTAGNLHIVMENDPFITKGEIVVLIEGASPLQPSQQISLEHEHILNTLLNEIPLKQAVQLTSKITGLRKKPLYQAALDIQESKTNSALDA